MLCEWDSQFPGYGMHLRSIYRDGWLFTTYETGGGYDGTEGELYNLDEDPHQWHNRWDDPAARSMRDDLVSDLRDNLPPAHEPRLTVEAPV